MEKLKDFLDKCKNGEINPTSLIVIALLIGLYVKTYNIQADDVITNLVVTHLDEKDLKDIKRTVCKKGLKSIIRKEADKKFLDIDLANNLIDKDYSNFRVEDTESISITMRSDVVCVALLKYEDGEIRVFDVDVVSDNNAPLLYLVQDINERLVRERI